MSGEGSTPAPAGVGHRRRERKSETSGVANFSVLTSVYARSRARLSPTTCATAGIRAYGTACPDCHSCVCSDSSASTRRRPRRHSGVSRPPLDALVHSLQRVHRRQLLPFFFARSTKGRGVVPGVRKVSGPAAQQRSRGVVVRENASVGIENVVEADGLQQLRWVRADRACELGEGRGAGRERRA